MPKTVSFYRVFERPSGLCLEETGCDPFPLIRTRMGNCAYQHCKIARMRISQNKQVQHFPNLYLPKFEGFQKKTESFSNLRTSTLCRTHISQKSWKGFSHQTRLVGRHTRELNLVYCFFGNMVGVLFLNNVPSTKKQS